MLGEKGDRKEGHIGYRVLKAAGDESIEAPEDRDTLRRGVS
jgi:hypothetical protein